MWRWTEVYQGAKPTAVGTIIDRIAQFATLEAGRTLGAAVPGAKCGLSKFIKTTPRPCAKFTTAIAWLAVTASGLGRL